MDVDIARGEVETVLCPGEPRADEGERDRRRLLHHVPELAGEGQFPFAGHERTFDEEDLPSDRCPREAGDDAGDRLLPGHLVPDRLLAQYPGNVGRGHTEWELGFAGDDPVSYTHLTLPTNREV